MRTNYTTFILILLLCVAGCSNEEDTANLTDNNTIRLSVRYDDAFTRGTPLSSSNQLSDMGVFAYYTGTGSNDWDSKGANTLPNFMNNQKVINDGANSGTDNWSYYPQMYWPTDTDANITFFAYAPYATSENGIGILQTQGGITLNYAVPSSCANQPDLMIAIPQKDLNRSHSGAINFNMKHGLTCIGFSATGSYVTITSIQLTNICTSGELSIDATTGELNWKTGTGQSYYEAIPNTTELDETMQSIVTSNGYLMMVPQTLPDNAQLIVKDNENNTYTFDLAGQIWKAGQKINYNLSLDEDPASIVIDELPDAFVGAFWRYNETRERIIRMNNDDAWEVFVLCTDDQWSKDDILLDDLPSNYSTTMGVAITSTIQQMYSSQPIIRGTGNISFRVGLKYDCELSSVTSNPRYAILLLRHSGLTKNHLIFLRQGERADVVNGTTRFSPYNLDDSEMDIGLKVTYGMVEYPTQSGGFKSWCTSSRMYPPYGNVSNWQNANQVNQDTIANICPIGYRIPSASDFNDLLATTGESNSQYAVGGLYADGYYDRKTIALSNSNNGNIYQVGSGADVAYDGFIVYNIETYASVFFPQGGRRDSNGNITEAGSTAYYWSTTNPDNSNTPYYLSGAHNANGNQKVIAKIARWCERIDACCIRPIAMRTIDSPNDIDGSLDGFTDEDGWE